MTTRSSKRGLIWLLFPAFVAGLALGVYHYALGEALGQVRARGASDLALAEDRLTARLARHREMAVTLADHPVLTSLTDGGSREAAERFLRAQADKTAALGLYYVRQDGALLASAGPALGEEALNGPWTRRAREQGALGRGHAVLGAQRRRAYFFAAPDFGEDGFVQAALVVAVDVEEVEFGWRSSRPAVYFTGEDGEVFISNRSELIFARIHDDPPAITLDGGTTRLIDTQMRAGMQIRALDLGPYIPRRALHLSDELPQIGMRAVALVDIAPAERLARLQALMFAAVCIAFGAILFLVLERRRALIEANRLLEARVAARTAELQRAQADLVQAGKLSALGQMSAGISHELNQPLMAIQQFADNGLRFLGKGKVKTAEENLGRIGELAGRAARIIKNLRAFARNESEPMGRVELGAVLRTAAELTEARLRAGGVTLDLALPDALLHVKAGEVRLGQVFVNLINNAADAMAEQAGEKRIEISTLVQAGRCRVELRDTGPGIEDPEKMFEPFYTTKAVGSGDGMGLGLSISYGLVESFGGRITGRNAAAGGAVFTVELELWPQEREEGTR